MAFPTPIPKSRDFVGLGKVFGNSGVKIPGFFTEKRPWEELGFAPLEFGIPGCGILGIPQAGLEILG